MTTHVCLFGGPGTGKSTTSHGLMYLLKSRGYKAEYVHEYAKDLTYAEDKYRLADQLYVLAKQHHPWVRLPLLDFTVNDGPFLQGLVYSKDKVLSDLTVNLYKSYNTINIFLQRDLTNHPYQNYGRTQGLEEAILLDTRIKGMLVENDIPFTELKVSNDVHLEIFNLLQKEL